MKFEIKDKKKCDIFISIFNNLKNFTDNTLINVNEDELYIQGMDNSHVSMYELKLNKSWFSEWDVSESVDFGICLPILNKILHTWSDKQHITIYTGKDDDKLDIEFTNDEKGDYNKFFQIPLMDIESDKLGIPETEYDVDITMKSKNVKNLIDELSTFNDTVNLDCNEDRVCISSSSSEGSMKVVINMDDIEVLAVAEGETVESSFSIKHIGHMCQFHKLAEDCIIHLSPDIPIQIKYEIDDTSMMRFFLAPKIDD